jgi:hypothetical protein
MRVLHLTLSFHPGGRREAITNLIQGLREVGCESHLCCLDESGCATEELNHLVPAIDVLHRRLLFDFRAVRNQGRLCDAHHVASRLIATLGRLLSRTFRRRNSCTPAPKDRV